MEQQLYEYRDGEGTPLVFLHPWLGSRNSWDPVLEKIDLENPFLLYDMRCHGKATCEKFEFEDLASDLEELLDRLEIRKPILVGYSMGGMVALQYAAEKPVEKMFLIATSASTPEPAEGSPGYFLQKLGEMDKRDWAEKIVDNYTGGATGVYTENAVDEIVNASREQLKYPLEAMEEFDVADELDEITSMVVAGEQDYAITMEKSRELAELLGARLETVDSTHLVLWERPAEISRMLERFLQEF